MSRFPHYPGPPAADAVRNAFAVHEMDVDFDQTNRNRRPRGKAVMIGHTTEVLKLANAFLTEVDRGLGQAALGSAP